MKKIIIALTALAFIAACTNQGSNTGITKQQGGTVVGGVLGGILGSNVGKGKGAIAGTIGGALLGAWAGSEVGASLDNADRAAASQAAQNSFEYGRTGVATSWSNPDSGNSGTVTPTKTYQSSGQTCREYTQTINVGGKNETAYGKACRQADGSWQIVN